MIIAHLADLHLGFRAYTRTTPAGVNQREADVSSATIRAFEMVAELAPHLVVIAGDVFHSVRPSNGAIADAFRALSHLAADLEGRPVVVIAGDRDTPRSSDTTSILDLFREIPGVHVATDRVERFVFPALETEVVAAPHAALLSGAAPRLSPRDRSQAMTSVLVAHASVQGAMEGDGEGSEGGAVLRMDSLASAGWDYVALGHHPLSLELAPRIAYCGSLERTATDVWADPGAKRGFLVFDTDSATSEMRVVEGRPIVDLPRLGGAGTSPAELSAAIRELISEAGESLDGSVVRLVVTDLPRPAVRELDQEPLRELRSRALHFVLDARPPARVSGSVRIRGVSLEQQVEEFLAGAWEPTMEGIDRDRLVELGSGYLRQAGERAR